MKKQVIKINEKQLSNIIKKTINEMWDIDDKGVVNYDEFGRTTNRSYADVNGIERGTPKDVTNILMHTPHVDRRAKTKYDDELEPNEFIDDTGKRIRPSHWYVKGSDVNKLTESQLRKMVSESVKKMLNEEYCWWGDTKPLETILQAANEITAHYSGYEESDWESYDSTCTYDLYKWAERIATDAESFLHSNADNVPINGGENW